MKLFRIVLVWILVSPWWVANAALPLDSIRLPDGFQIGVYAEGLRKPRAMVLGDGGTVFAGSCKGCRDGRLYALRDTDGDHVADEVRVIDGGLADPVGVTFRQGALYASARTRILRYDDIETRLDDPPEPVVVLSGLPGDGGHQWRFIAFGPDDKLYVPVGAPCNICERESPFASILRVNPDGSGMEVFARGVRNTVGFDWHPETGDLWFTDNGRDWLGDDLPPDELNWAPRSDMHFGYPYCHGGDLLDPEFGAGHDCANYTPPVQKLGAHVAGLGMAFYTGDQFPAEYDGAVFIAEHGSWNRSTKSGYRVTVVRLDDNRAVSYEPFAEGWLRGENAWGRPAAVLVMPDGSLLVSDDAAGAIYRISYQP